MQLCIYQTRLYTIDLINSHNNLRAKTLYQQPVSDMQIQKFKKMWVGGGFSFLLAAAVNIERESHQ